MNTKEIISAIQDSLPVGYEARLWEKSGKIRIYIRYGRREVRTYELHPAKGVATTDIPTGQAIWIEKVKCFLPSDDPEIDLGAAAIMAAGLKIVQA